MNMITVVGNVVRDPESRVTKGGLKVCNFTIADNTWVNGNSVATYFKCVVWEKTADLCEKFLEKGKMVQVFGPVKAEAYVARGGDPKGTIVINVDKIQFLSKKKESQEYEMPEERPMPDSGYIQVDAEEIPFD